MSEKRSPKDEQLIKSLQEKLDWYTFEATDEEFDEAQVEAILNLLQSLDPLPEMYVPRDPLEPSVREVPIADADPNIELGPDGKPVLASDPVAAFERFKKRYHITDEDLAAKDRAVGKEGGVIKPFRMDVSAELTPDAEEVKDRLAQAAAANQDSSAAQETGTVQADTASVRGGTVVPIESKTAKHRVGKTVGRVAAAAVIVAAAGTALSIGTSAVAQKPFFEVVRDGMHSIKITVTGNRMDNVPELETVDFQAEDVNYNSWDEVKAEHQEILVPSYIPEGLVLKELYRQSSEMYEYYVGEYRFDDGNRIMIISIEYFEDGYAQIGFEEQDRWDYLEETGGVAYYQSGDYYHALWHDSNCLYVIDWIDLEELKEVVKEMFIE